MLTSDHRGNTTNDGLPGLGVSITGSNGYRDNLFHFAEIAPGIGVGTQIQAGQIIGYMGATGNAGVVHLHFEIRGLGPGRWVGRSDGCLVTKPTEEV